MTLDITHPRLQELFDYWNRRRDDRAMPRRAEIDPLDLRKMLPHIFLVDVEDGGRRFRYRLVGSALAEIVERDLTGVYLDEMPFLFRQFAAPDYRAVVARKTPCYREASALEGLFTIRYKRLVLPLSENGVDVNMLLGGIFPA